MIKTQCLFVVEYYPKIIRTFWPFRSITFSFHTYQIIQCGLSMRSQRRKLLGFLLDFLDQNLATLVIVQKGAYLCTAQRKSKMSGKNYDIYSLTCRQFPLFLMAPMYFAKILVLHLKRLKTSNVYYYKSVKAIFSAPNHFLHLS